MSNLTKDPTQRPGRPPESASFGPSVISQDNMNFGRFIGLVSACLTLFSGMILTLSMYGYKNMIGFGPTWATIGISFGLIGLLFHAAYDRDVEFRRIYMGLGFAALALGAVLCIIPQNAKALSLFPLGYPLMILGLLFQIAFLRNEDDPKIRDLTQGVLGITGAALAICSMLGGLWFASTDHDFLIPYGLLLAVLGLFYLVACVGVKGTGDDRSYWVGLGFGGFGVLAFLLALLRSVAPSWFQTEAKTFFLPWGVLLMGLAISYVLTSLVMISESRLAVMLRRELGAYFYSSMAYLILIGFTISHWIAYFLIGWALIDVRVREPIVAHFIFGLIPVVFVLFAIPALTMRLISEERRTGTLEVTMTAPLEEWHLVLSKFLAGLLIYMLMWIPFGLFLVAFRIGVETNFDYRPLLSFAIALVVTGAAFISMGVFFSSLSRNSLISGVLTFIGMLAMLSPFLIQSYLRSRQEGGGIPAPVWLLTILKHINFLQLWDETLNGQLIPRMLLFPISMTIVWLFLSVKVLEARKWL